MTSPCLVSEFVAKFSECGAINP